MTDKALVAQPTDAREAALLKAIGFDKLAPEQRELAVSIANRYDLDPMLKHLVLIDGKPFITRDGLLWVAHRSGQLDGIEVTKPVLIDGFWESTASVYRKDMTRPFTFPGRFPKAGRNATYAPEMAIKCAESMALRRAFNVAAPVVEERFDSPEAMEIESQSASAPSLAERAAARRAEIASTSAEVSPETPPTFGGNFTEHAAETREGSGISGDDFRAALERAGIDIPTATAKAKELFPGVRNLDDSQRFELLLALTGPEEAPSVPMFDPAGEAEIDAALANV